jgi:hypothetical protein
MSDTTGKQFSVGLRYAAAFALDENGFPDAPTSGSPAPERYEGVQWEGAKAFALTVPEPRQISHTGDDRLLARDVLPPLEGAGAEFKISKQNYPLLALVTGVLEETIGENVGILLGTDQQGSEPQVGLWFYQQSLDAETSGSGAPGSRRWRGVFFPKAFCIPQVPGMTDEAAEVTIKVTPMIVSQYPWGQAFTLQYSGATTGQVIDRMFTGKPKMDVWRSDGTLNTFALAKTALTTDKISVFVDGIEKTTNMTVTTTSVTFTDGDVAVDSVICILYEY